MICFARGLVLRRGERTLEFERALEGGKIQLKFLDTFEVNTFELAKLYADILSGVMQVVHTQPLGLVPSHLEEPKVLLLPSQLNPAQEAIIGFRMHYIKAALRLRATAGSARQCANVIATTSDPVGADETESDRVFRFSPPKPATLMRWLKIFQSAGGNPYALCDRRPLAPKPKRLDTQAELIMEEAIAKHYLQLRGKSMKDTHRQTQLAIGAFNRREGSALPLPSERTINRRILEIPKYLRDCKRLGVGYAKNKWRYSLAGDQSTRTMERAEIDHTMLDIWVLDPRSGVPLGRPWITVVMDRMSGYPLGVYISFYGPSSATVASALKTTILPKDDILAAIPEITVPWSAMGVAETYVVDNGLEFHARTFRRIAWELRADLIYNPVRQPWLKASVERVMMEFNRTLPMPGKVYTPIKNALPPDPQKSAAILFDDLCTCLLMWAAQVFPYRTHPKTLIRPIDLWEEGKLSSPPPMMPTDLKQLELATGISTTRRIGGDGVFFQYLRFNSPELQDYRRTHGESFVTEVRFNPDNIGAMHVLLPKSQQWLSVPLQRPSQAYGQGLSLLQHQITREEAGKKLTRANAEEELLKAEQRVKDRWGDAIRRGVKVRKNADLIRMQGFTSAQIIHAKGDALQVQSTATLEVSPVVQNMLPQVMPFKTFSLEEDF
jgi:putative transposase